MLKPPLASRSDRDRRRVHLYVLALAGLILVSRLPQLLSPDLLLDGDECYLGLLAKHVAEGKEFPIFFYGQHYGLSTFEAVAGAFAFLVFGTGAVPLKLAMLALWTGGALLLFLALTALVGEFASFWITSVLVLNPVWAVFSMKARGGYVTAFTATAALLWLLLKHCDADRVVRWVAAGVLTAIIYLAQPLWLPGVLPLVIAELVSRRRLTSVLAYASAAALLIFVVNLAPATSPAPWAPPRLGDPDPIGSLPRVARQIHVNLTGSYYLTTAIEPPGRATELVALIWCTVLAFAVPVQVFRLITRRYYRWSHLLFLSIASTLVAEWLLLWARDARYLLPIGVPLVALAGIELTDVVRQRLLPSSVAIGLTAVALVLGSASMVEFSRFNFLWGHAPTGPSEARRLRQVINDLKIHDVKHVFAMNGLLDPQLAFYSDERVVARWTDPIGRYPASVHAVDRALANGDPVAVVGYTNQSGAPGCWDVPICTGGIENLVPDPQSIVTFDNKYFVYFSPTRELLEKLRFRFWD